MDEMRYNFTVLKTYTQGDYDYTHIHIMYKDYTHHVINTKYSTRNIAGNFGMKKLQQLRAELNFGVFLAIAFRRVIIIIIAYEVRYASKRHVFK